MTPTFSILLPCRNEAKFMRTQLEAILPQLAAEDEIIALDDGSTDDTSKVFGEYLRPGDKLLINSHASGVCQAYNLCAEWSENDIFLGTSGNDCVQPGTLDRARQAFSRWPDAKVAFGRIQQWRPATSIKGDAFIRPDQLPLIWQQSRGFLTHGAAAFIRRECWGQGYNPKFQWMADFYQTLFLAMRHGFIWIDHVCSEVKFTRDSFSGQHLDAEKYNAVVAELVKEWASPEYDDIRSLGTEFDRICGWLRPRFSGSQVNGWGPVTGRLPGRLATPEEVSAMKG